ncbi:S8 family serine peptidase [Neobacillus dielmonensis]|uniref:S8 family serine peptidase n=1 Tax=Neobacillus dielmonensis TaxID=1347369 RepID=UPI0005A758B6|nr:S8 family serine peptidase [Neobacillus dielmonensis]
MKKRNKGIAVVASSILAISLSSLNLQASAQAPAKTYLIAYKQSSLPKTYQQDINKAGGEVINAIPEIGGLEVRSSNPNFLSNLKSNSSISAANVEMRYKLDDEQPAKADGQPVTLTPDKDGTFWSSQWDIRHLTNEGKSFKIESGGTATNGKVTHKAIVGVIDTGIDANHPDLKANYVGGQSFVPKGGYNGDDTSETGDKTDVLDREGHGTHVAGSIAGNGKIKGVGPDLGIRAYRIFDSSGSAPTAPIVSAMIQAAKDKVDVVNMSIGGYDNLKYQFDGTSYSDIADVLLWKRAIKYAVQNNVTLVASAGNEELNYADKKSLTDYLNVNYGDTNLVFKGVTIETPGGLPGVITVSSSNSWSKDQLAFYSNYGNSFITVAAPGGDNGPKYAASGDLNDRDFTYRALSTWPTYLEPYFTTIDPEHPGYAYLHGTSMASPKVAGIAGLIKAAHPDYKPAQVEALIEKTALDYGKPGYDAYFGSGEANAYTAVTGK